jgi:hypothetical protein
MVKGMAEAAFRPIGRSAGDGRDAAGAWLGVTQQIEAKTNPGGRRQPDVLEFANEAADVNLQIDIARGTAQRRRLPDVEALTTPPTTTDSPPLNNCVPAAWRLRLPSCPRAVAPVANPLSRGAF